jgi:tellurite resistance protein TehA-like permease
LWSIVFPVGMYRVASHELGSALSVAWLVMLGRYETWLALAVWAVVSLALAATLMRSARLPDPSAPASQ